MNILLAWGLEEASRVEAAARRETRSLSTVTQESENIHLVLAERLIWWWVRGNGVEKMRCQANISVAITALRLMSFVIFLSLYSQTQYAIQNKK